MARTRRDNITDQMVDPEDSDSDKEVNRVKIVKTRKSRSRKVNLVQILHSRDADDSTKDMDRFNEEAAA